jgi:predicted AAA+ superfamily ATPase
MFSKTHSLASLEDLDVRARAVADPAGFLDSLSMPVILDEIQHVPELLPYIKTRIDKDRRPGQWLLTGSQNFALMQGVSQSLAGRVAVFALLPFNLAESAGYGEAMLSPAGWCRRLDQMERRNHALHLDERLLRGAYPEIAVSRKVDRLTWCRSYVATYLERDVRQLAHVGDLRSFETFLRICAARTAQILDLTELAGELGVSLPTVKRWISVLEASYQIFLLQPFYRNIGKRLIKRPKLYFLDTGLATFLMGLHDREALRYGPSFGALFETLIVAEFLKRFHHSGEMPALYYLRTQDGLEVDLVLELSQKLHCFEIKSSATLTPLHAKSFRRLKSDVGELIATQAIISCSNTTHPVAPGIPNIPWWHLAH